MRIATFILSALLCACAAAPKPTVKQPADAASQRAALDRMTPEFLYLAADQALQEGNLDGAILFLKTLVAKDAGAVDPRIQLAELQLQRGRPDKVEAHIKALQSTEGITEDQRIRIALLQARLLVIQKKPDQASEVLDRLLIQHPANLSARLLLVRLLESSGKFDAAHSVIRDGLKLEKQPRLYRMQVQLYVRQQEYDKAEQTIRKWMKQMPDDESPVLMLSQIAREQGRTKEAEAVLRSYLSTHAQALRVRNALGRMLVEQERVEEAIAIYEQLADRTGGDADILAALGLLYFQQEHYGKAVDAFRRSLARRPNDQTRYYLAASLEAAGEEKKAKDLYDQIGRESAAYAEAQMRLAGLDIEADRLKAAAKRLRRLIREQPKNFDAYAMLSAVRLGQKQYERLLAETEAAVNARKTPPRLLFNRAAAYEALKQYDEAASQLKRMLAIEPDSAEALNFLGYLYAEQGIHLDKAEALINRALAQKPNDGYYLDSLAWVYFQRGEYPKALEIQNRAVAIIKDDPVMQEHLGDILWKIGDTQAARKAWRRAIELEHTEAHRIRNKIARGL